MYKILKHSLSTYKQRHFMTLHLLAGDLWWPRTSDGRLRFVRAITAASQIRQFCQGTLKRHCFFVYLHGNNFKFVFLLLLLFVLPNLPNFSSYLLSCRGKFCYKESTVKGKNLHLGDRRPGSSLGLSTGLLI